MNPPTQFIFPSESFPSTPNGFGRPANTPGFGSNAPLSPSFPSTPNSFAGLGPQTTPGFGGLQTPTVSVGLNATTDTLSPTPSPPIQPRDRVVPANGNQPVARPLLIGRLQVDNLGKDYGLTEDQTECLYNMSFLASNSGNSGDITVPQLAVSLMGAAVTFSCWNRRFDGDEQADDARRLMMKMELRLDKDSSLSRAQNKSLRIEAGVLLYNPARTTYRNLGKNLYSHIEADAAKLGFAACFETPAKAKAFSSSCNAMASNVRGALRQTILNSLLQNKSLGVVTTALNKTYMSGKTQYNEYAVQIRNAFLRRIFVENPGLFLTNEPADETNSEGADDVTEPDSRKRKRANAGRPAQGKDYWGVVDEWYEEKLKGWGNDMSIGHWKEYIEETLQKEKDGYANGLAIGLTLGKSDSRSVGAVAGPSNGAGSFINALTGGASV